MLKLLVEEKVSSVEFLKKVLRCVYAAFGLPDPYVTSTDVDVSDWLPFLFSSFRLNDCRCYEFDFTLRCDCGFVDVRESRGDVLLAPVRRSGHNIRQVIRDAMVRNEEACCGQCGKQCPV